MLSDEFQEGIQHMAKEALDEIEKAGETSPIDGATWAFFTSTSVRKISRVKCLLETDLTESEEVGEDPGHVSLVIVPTEIGSGQILPVVPVVELTKEAVDALTCWVWQILDERRLITCQHHVSGPTYTEFYINADVISLPRVPAREL